jgi:hypothetical protein
VTRQIFIAHPSIRLILAGLTVIMGARLSAGGWSQADVLVWPLVVVGWILQEWFIHKFLLHDLEGWYGREVRSQLTG